MSSCSSQLQHGTATISLQQLCCNNRTAQCVAHIYYISLHWHKQRQQHMSEHTHIYGCAAAIFTFHPFFSISSVPSSSNLNKVKHGWHFHRHWYHFQYPWNPLNEPISSFSKHWQKFILLPLKVVCDKIINLQLLRNAGIDLGCWIDRRVK